MPADASWCSLCFAPLAAQAVDPWVAAAIAEAPAAPEAPAPLAPAPVAYEPVAPPPAPVALPPVPVAYEPLPVAPPPVMPAPPVMAAPVAELPVVEAAPALVATAVATVEAPTWPCTACDTRVDFAESACPNCNTPFMGGTNSDVSLKVPVVGDLVHMSAGAKFGVMAGGAVGLAMLLVLLFLVLGHIF